MSPALSLIVLKLLDSDTRKNSSNSQQDTADGEVEEEKRDMNKWLRDKLEKADVISIVEPYWSTLYREVKFKYTVTLIILENHNANCSYTAIERNF